MDICILTPFGARTGGPEATLQLSDALISNNWPGKVYSVYYDLAQVGQLKRIARKEKSAYARYVFGKRDNLYAEYAHYRINVSDAVPDDEGTLIVIPETILDIAPCFHKSPKLIWWLSVDNAFAAMSRCNLNELRRESVFHAAQSAYAYAFAETLGLRITGMLSDYTSASFTESEHATQREARVAINAGPKVVCDLDALESAIKALSPALTIDRIHNKTREEVRGVFAVASVFVDLGTFPGKDRMAREANRLGCPVIIGAAGAGSYKLDFPVPEEDRIHPWQIKQIAERIYTFVNSSEAREKNIASLRASVDHEKALFLQETLEVFRRIQPPSTSASSRTPGQAVQLFPSGSWRLNLPRKLQRVGLPLF
jgi:hypothetical protein